MMSGPQAFSIAPQSKGGLAVVAKYGLEYMRQLGRRGYQTTVDRYFDGDRAAANRWLSQRGLYVQDEAARPAHGGD